MAALFWAFSYVLLTIRGAMFHDDWSRLIVGNRILAVSVGAAAYALVLRRLQGGERPSLATAISWIVGATLLIMLVRLGVDQLMFDVPQPVEIHLLWSLSWSGYFGLWLMGAIAFDAAPVPPAVAARESIATIARMPVASAPRLPASADIDEMALLIDAIVQEAAVLDPSNRDELATRVLRLGGYEMAGDDDWSRSQTARAQFAAGLAARLKRNGT